MNENTDLTLTLVSLWGVGTTHPSRIPTQPVSLAETPFHTVYNTTVPT